MKRLAIFVFYFMMLGISAFGLQSHSMGFFGEAKPEMAGLEEQLKENAKLGIRAVEFPRGLDWFNVWRPLEMGRLNGKAVLLDFWTFCCINCMHVIPELKRLEEKYPKELVVVGVHSAKFSNERDSENIRQSILRYEVRHPVVNDPGLLLWQAYGVHAWPTLVLIDPEGHVVLEVSGEGHYDLLDRAVSSLIRHAESRGVIDRSPLAMAFEETRDRGGDLRFPGKIFADQNGLVVSDSNHNRILVLDTSGNVLEIIGRGQRGSSDGNFEKAEFDHPQGVFREDGFIYVADTENHLIRQIDLNKKTVSTIAGTGARGGSLHGKAAALKTPLNSPWDLVKVVDGLYIAMAGAHQIWSLDLKLGVLDLFAGSGREDIIDGSGASSALAQPSGITFDGQKTFFLADSEVSAVRMIDLKSREVETLIGRGLFEFGDEDGSWREASLQHPLGVHYADGIVYVADTYNDKIKAINLKAKTIRTIAGSGESGFADGAPGALYEPAGLSTANGNLFIADTNNHSIRIFNLASGKLSTLQVTKDSQRERRRPLGTSISGSKERSAGKNPFLQIVEYPEETLRVGAQASVGLLLPKDHEFTEGIPLHFKIQVARGPAIRSLKVGTLPRPAKELPITFDLSRKMDGQAVLGIDIEVSYCTTVTPKLCKFKSLKLIQPISFGADGKSKLELRTKIE